MAQEHFDETFPGFRTEKLTLVIESDADKPVSDQQVADIRNRAMAISGFVAYSAVISGTAMKSAIPAFMPSTWRTVMVVPLGMPGT